MRWIIFLSLATFISADVFILTDDNFDQTINQGKPVMVKFFAPWCGHCKEMAPEYIKLAEEVEKSGENFIIAELDATVHSKAAAKYEVKGYPTLKLFMDGVPVKYEGERRMENMLSFIRKKSQPASTELKSQEEVKEKAEVKGRRCILVSDSAEDLKDFKSAARTLEKFSFFHTSEQTGKAVFPEITKPSVILLRDFGEKKIVYEGPFDTTKLVPFLRDHQEDVIVDFDSEVMKEIFDKRSKKAVMLLYNEKLDEEANKHFRAFATSKKSDDFLFVKITNTDEWGQRIIKYLSIDSNELPVVEILDVKSGTPLRYRHEGKFELKELEEFMDKYGRKELKRFMKSEAVPKENPGPVYKVVGSNFKQEVIDNDSDVLVKLYAEWCGHCKRLAPIYVETAEELKNNKKLKLVEMDATKNDVEGVTVKSFPTIFLFPAGKKDAPVKFDGTRTVEGFTKFLKETATNPVEVLKKDL
eukprot:TRINITY_DN1516_c0_g3_i3.p1 TRINITY_DN1516_c0_g3~~TRINITY_DN1516_c0_g3_i3.p1  ORF type:complete len:471 (-),score=189.02 TRINITY_DN1516_c0_g3_i3:60-1472(-)